MMTQHDGARAAVSAPEDAGNVYLDQSLWSRLGDAPDVEAFAQPWLALQCRMIADVVHGVLVLGHPDQGPFRPAAQWPARVPDGAPVLAAAELAVTERRGVVQDRGSSQAVAYPVVVAERLYGVAAVEVAGHGDDALRAVMRQLQWGSAWLKLVIGQHALVPKERLAAVLDLVASGLAHQRFEAAAIGVVTELAARLRCDRVSVGFRDRGHVRVRALSHSAEFGKRSNLVRALGQAMDEALDQQALIVHRPGVAPPLEITRAHAMLSEEQGASAIATVPFGDGDTPNGAFTFETGDAALFDDDETVELLQHAALVVGPLLDAKRREDRWLVHKAGDSLARQLKALLGAGHLGLKLTACMLIALAAFLATATGTYRVSADATLEGTVQRAIVAPFGGYVADAMARAGDVVARGDVVATLDDQDLTLERLKWLSQREQYNREHREAVAARDRAQSLILAARVSQAEAQLALIEAQLERTRLTAPIDGVLVSGDLSQSLDAPVERGDVLFEVAPLAGYRVILEVDERDVGDVVAGQIGRVALAGAPGTPLSIQVEEVTPVATARDGRNFFRVEARLDDGGERLRPGMEGVAKVEVETRRLVWIWTRRLVDWLRLTLWSLSP